jgi:hypothetical protein
MPMDWSSARDYAARYVHPEETLVTEAQWLELDDPSPLYYYMPGTLTARKRRLFACACCRLVLSAQTDRRCKLAIEVVERYADGLATGTDLAHALDAAAAVAPATRDAAARACYCAASATDNLPLATARAALEAPRADYRAGRKAQAAAFLDLVGNPFRPGSVADIASLARNDGTVGKLAQCVYDDRAYNRLPLLADSLEDAGCTDAEVLGHLRGPGPHVRGCWAVDLLLGKS